MKEPVSGQAGGESKTMLHPLISVIVAVYNSASTLEVTIRSIVNQTYPNIELVIIDGGSTDGSLDIIKKYQDQISYWVSEKDKGISDAFNKGVLASTGAYINFQGAGDLFEANDSVEQVFKEIGNNKPIFISARIRRVDALDENKTLWISPLPRNRRFNKSSLLLRMSLYHQGLFTHRSFFDTYGLFDGGLKFSMDYEHILRAYKNFPTVMLVDKIVSRWRADGVGNNRELEIFREYDHIKRKNNVASSLVLTAVHYWTLLKHFIKKII